MKAFFVWIEPVAAAELSESASVAGVVTLQGMLTIFLVLVVLWGVMEAVHRLLRGASSGSEKKKGEAAPAANPEDAALAAAIAAALAANEDEGAVVAAITAAITAQRAEQGESGGFRVVSFRRRDNGRRTVR